MKGKKTPPKENHYARANSGTKSTLSDDLYAQILEMARNGKTNVEIYTFLGIPEDTWYTWHARNTNDFKDKLAESRRAYLLDISEDALTKLAQSKNERIQLQAVMFLSERLGKRWYATKTEYQIDEKEGKEIEPENKEKLEKLLTTPIKSPIQIEKPTQ